MPNRKAVVGLDGGTVFCLVIRVSLRKHNSMNND